MTTVPEHIARRSLVRDPVTGRILPGMVLRVAGRTADDRPYYADLPVPVGLSAYEAALAAWPDRDPTGRSTGRVTWRDLYEAHLLGHDAEVEAWAATLPPRTISTKE